jgi:hypothetical protein
VLLTVKSGALYVYTGRRTIAPEAARDQAPERFIEFVRKQGATHMLLADVDYSEQGAFLDLVSANCEELGLLKAFGHDTLLFSFNPQGPDAREAACRAAAGYQAALLN